MTPQHPVFRFSSYRSDHTKLFFFSGKGILSENRPGMANCRILDKLSVMWSPESVGAERLKMFSPMSL